MIPQEFEGMKESRSKRVINVKPRNVVAMDPIMGKSHVHVVSKAKQRDEVRRKINQELLESEDD